MTNPIGGLALAFVDLYLGTLRAQGGPRDVPFCETTDSTLLSVVNGAHPLASADTNYVRSPDDYSDPGPGPQCAFPPAVELLLASEYPEISMVSDPSVYLLWQTPIGAGHTGYALLVRGMYNPNRVDLYVYDASRREFSEPVLLAEFWGGAGEVHWVRSWLLDINRDGYLDVMRHTCATWFDIEDSESPRPETSVVRDHLESLLWVRNGFGASGVVRDPSAKARFAGGHQACLPN